LHYAAENGNPDIVQHLIKSGIDVDERDDNGEN
jgi:ankyrin repeat protein